MMVFSGLLLTEMTGMTVEERGAVMNLLPDAKPPGTKTEVSNTHVLVAVNRGNQTEMAFADTLTATLDEMRMHYHTVDVSRDPLPDLEQLQYFPVLQPVAAANGNPYGSAV